MACPSAEPFQCFVRSWRACRAPCVGYVGQRRELSRGHVVMDSLTVLCIDDHPQILELRKATLESLGYRVKIASSGYTAMKILEERSAEALACLIKQRFPNLPIILLSAYSEMPERILWLVDEYVMRSEFPEQLVPIIERACRRTTFGRRAAA